MKIKALKGPKRHFKGSKGSSSKIKAFKGFKGSLGGLVHYSMSGFGIKIKIKFW